MHFSALVSSVLMTTAFALLATEPLRAAPANLSPAALECYTAVLGNSQIFTMNKNYKTDDAIEKLAISLCTYSDAAGATKCYLQAQSQDAVLKNSKQFANGFVLEQKYARLCSNSHKNNFNSVTEDMDAIDCIKNVTSDSNILVAAKQFMDGTMLDDLTTKLCISSNGAGASQCYLKSIDKAGQILKANKNYKGDAALDQIIVDLCKGSRL